MPSKKRKSARKRKQQRSIVTRKPSAFFIPYLIFLLIMWVIYRTLFSFDVWFDEIIGKAVFFGLPVWLYVSATNAQDVVDTFHPNKLAKGLLLGLAVGGIFGFTGSVMGIMLGTGQVAAAALFSASAFWWEFFLAFMTASWETLFFFSWVMTMVMGFYKKWPLLNQVLLTAAIFVAFHIPNTILRFGETGLVAVTSQAFLLFLFAIGQAYFFSRWKNYYALVLSHAIWGMVLLIHVM